MRWSHWSQLPADKALKHVKEKLCPFCLLYAEKEYPMLDLMAEQMYKGAGGPTATDGTGAGGPPPGPQTTQEQKDVIDAEFEEHR